MKIYKITLSIVILFFTFIMWIIYLANTGQSSLFFDLSKSIPYGDKFGHFFLFGFLTLGVNMVLMFKHIKIGKFKIYTGTICVSLFVLTEELSQHFSVSRTLDINDIIADASGIFSITLIYSFISKKSTGI